MNNEPAFPSIRYADGVICRTDEGMTLRDYFAAKAMLMKLGPANSTMEMHDMAHHCYVMADAMMRARK